MPKNNSMLSEGDRERRLSTGKVRISENIDIFMCPICGNRMYLKGFKSIICLNGHCFDISQRGYINLLQNQAKTQYNRELFKSRDIICGMGFFEPMIGRISGLISDNTRDLNRDHIRVLDAGCGEGSHLVQITDDLSAKTDIRFQGVGTDISKAGIKIASKNNSDIIWCVADLARLPFANKRFDVVLNILSPANYREFNRIIKDDGLLIKVVPGNCYLKELRSVFYHGTGRKPYSSDRVVEYFGSNFKIIDIQRIEYHIEIDGGNLEHLIRMTPLSWGVPADRIRKVLDMGIDSVSVDFTIVSGKRKAV